MSNPLSLASKSANSEKPLAPSGIEECKQLDFAALTGLSKSATAAMHEYVCLEFERIATVAQDTANIYWEVQREARNDPNVQEPCFVGTRVRLKDMTLSAEWYRNRFSRDGQVAAGDKRGNSRRCGNHGNRLDRLVAQIKKALALTVI